MKKKTLWLMLTALLMLLILPMTASADMIYADFTIHIGIGETLKIDFPDLSDKIGTGLTKDDFDITYHIEDQYGYIRGTVDENDCLTMNMHSPGRQIIEITYTPKKYGVGKKTVFWANIVVYEALTNIYVETDNVVMSVDEKMEVRYNRTAGSAPDVEVTGYDSSIVKATLDDKLYLTAAGVGETDVVIRAYNGVSATVHVKVTNPPTQLEIAQDDFVCYVGDTIPLDIDLGDGYMNAVPKISMSKDGSFVWYDDFFLDDNWHEIYIAEPGNYKVTMTTYNGHSDSFTFSAYSRENCTIMTITQDPIVVGDAYVYIYCYDANGKTVTPRFEITQGSDIAKVVDKKLVTTGAGTVTVRAINPDGSTVECTVEVHEKPTSIALNASKLTLDIGESFDFEVIFDKGKADYYFDCFFWQNEPPYSLYPLSVKGQTVIATAPGTATISVSSGGLYAECFVTVLDGDKALSIDHPTGDFGIGHTYQLRVVDKTGKVYPATFRLNESATYAAAVVTPDGLMTGQKEGYTYIYADVEDGRTLRFKQEVQQIPTWISHENVTLKINTGSPSLGVPTSDVGPVSDVTTKIADESIATFKNGFKLLKEGTTEVTMTANKGGATCTFLLTVLPADDTIYIMADGQRYNSHYYSVDIPDGFSKKLPDVTDYYGNKISVTWKITYQHAGFGNPNSTAFRLSNGSIKATWVSGSCEITATTKDGRSIVMNASAYRLPDKIKFRDSTYTVNVGEHAQTEVEKDEAMVSSARVGELTWKVGDASIIRFDERYPSTGMPTVTGLKPGTTTLTATQPNGAKAVCTITVVDPNYLAGDADENHKVDANDALLIFQKEAGWSVSLNTSYADVNKDGSVNMEDAVLILRYAAGEDVTLK